MRVKLAIWPGRFLVRDDVCLTAFFGGCGGGGGRGVWEGTGMCDF